MLYNVDDALENFARLRLRLKVGGTAEVGCQLTASAMLRTGGVAVHERSSPQFEVFTATSLNSVC